MHVDASRPLRAFTLALLCAVAVGPGTLEGSASGFRPMPVCGDATHELLGTLEAWQLGSGPSARAIEPVPQGFRLVINPRPGLAGVPLAVAALERAADRWRRIITDPITVTIDAELGAYDGREWLGIAGARYLTLSYDGMRTALIRDAGSGGGIVGAMPPFDRLSFVPPSIDRTTVIATKANLKALGFGNLDDLYGARDGTIRFNTSGSRFDFDARDGIDPGAIDFESVAAHEIGHLLGFVSSVDEVDAGNGQAAATPLDLFRFASGGPGDPGTTDQFATFPRSLAPGVESHLDTMTEAWPVSTGSTMGDRRQASHWKDASLTRVLIGVMDPTFARGARIPITGADERALDLVGWDMAPHATACTTDQGCDDGDPRTTERCAFGACATVATAECLEDAECERPAPCARSQCVNSVDYEGVSSRACVALACLPTDPLIVTCFGSSFTDQVDLRGCLGRARAKQFKRALRRTGRLVKRASNLGIVTRCPEPFADSECQWIGATGTRAIAKLGRAARLLDRASTAALKDAASDECRAELGSAIALRVELLRQTREECVSR